MPVQRGDFGKIGAFVMQDDILIETMTVYECFVFAQRMRTSLNKEEIHEKADEMVKRLQL